MVTVSIKKTYENTWYTLRRCTKKVRYYALFEILHEIITDLSPSPIAVKMGKWSMESWQGIPGKFANTSFLVFPWEWTRLILSGNSFLGRTDCICRSLPIVFRLDSQSMIWFAVADDEKIWNNHTQFARTSRETSSMIYWLVVSTHLKNISKLGWLFQIYGN